MSNVINELKIPVSIADLPAADFQVGPDTLTEAVVAELEKSPELPGVLIVERGQLLGFITRLKLFERLGHRYGVELFLRKPISALKKIHSSDALILPGHLKVDEAVQRALSRPPADIYDPVVLQLDEKTFRILDINILFLAQSKTVSNLSNIVGQLQQIDNLIYRNWDTNDVFRHTLQLLGRGVPYHQAAVLARLDGRLQVIASAGLGKTGPGVVEKIEDSSLFKMMIQHHQAIFLPDACHLPVWAGMEALGMPLAWLGIPLFDGMQTLGLLSLGRNVNSSFTAGEKETSKAFAQRIVKVLLRGDAATTADFHKTELPPSLYDDDAGIHELFYSNALSFGSGNDSCL